jgi:hypothetical protein
VSESWGWGVRRLTAEEVARLDRAEASARESGASYGGWYRRCKVAPKCQGKGTHEVTYNYVTGRAGRVSWARKLSCDDHAAMTAVKHGIEITSGEAPKHALDRVIEG